MEAVNVGLMLGGLWGVFVARKGAKGIPRSFVW